MAHDTRLDHGKGNVLMVYTIYSWNTWLSFVSFPNQRKWQLHKLSENNAIRWKYEFNILRHGWEVQGTHSSHRNVSARNPLANTNMSFFQDHSLNRLSAGHSNPLYCCTFCPLWEVGRNDHRKPDPLPLRPDVRTEWYAFQLRATMHGLLPHIDKISPL